MLVAARAPGGTATGHVVDRAVRQPEGTKLRADAAPQIDEHLLPCLVTTGDHAGGGGPDDRLADVLADLEAARTNAGADRGDEPALTSPELQYGCTEDVGHDAAPSGVNRRHAAARGIGDQDGDAIGDAHRDGRSAACLGHQRVGLLLEQRRRIARAADHRAAMHLLRLVEPRRIVPDGLGQAALVLGEPSRVAQDREVEAVVGWLAHAPEARRETVRKTCSFQGFRGEKGEQIRHGLSWYHGSAMARQQDPFIGRDVLNGQFQILQKIGSGGMGSVYKALQPAMNRMVAIKILHPKLASRKDLVSRFRREARAMSHLTHPNTVKVYLYGELEDGSLYIVMEYLEGKNLNQTVRSEGAMTIERGLPILIQACNALDEAHRAGIIHRDLKPENIFVTTQGGMKDFAKVLDFGLAKVTEREMRPGSIILTQEGMVFGTPEFMSPEQAQGKSLTPGSDIYSLAVILYEVLTGKLPFDAKNPMEFIQLHVTTKPKPINERVPGKTFPPLLWTVLSKALEKRSEDRYQSAAEFAHALQAVLSGATEVPPFVDPADPRAPRQNPSAGNIPTPLQAQPARAPAGTGPAVPVATRSSPLLREPQESAKPPLGLLVGIAVAFLVIGAVLAAVVLKLFGK